MKGFIIVLTAIIFFIACSSSNGPKCDGNCFNGYGVKKWKDGSYIKANWKNGEPNGKGTKYFGSGSEFSGDTYNGSFNGGYDGYGIYYDSSEDAVHKGYWKNGKPNGYGITTFGPHSANPFWHYEGGWKDGKKFGYGILDLGTVGQYAGVRYSGNWLNDKMEGLGKYSWPDSSRYVGHFSSDHFEGEGVFVFNDGYTYKSEWYQGDDPEFLKVLAWHSKNAKDHDGVLLKFFGIDKSINEIERPTACYISETAFLGVIKHYRGSSTPLKRVEQSNGMFKFNTYQTHIEVYKKGNLTDLKIDSSKEYENSVRYFLTSKSNQQFQISILQHADHLKSKGATVELYEDADQGHSGSVYEIPCKRTF